MKDVQRNPARYGRGFLGRRGWIWHAIASWFIPVIMTCAYIAFAMLADTDATNWAWMSLGLLFVLCLWWVFRELSQTAALVRASDIGDADAVMEIATAALASKLVVGRQKLVLYQAAAHELRGDWPRALASIREANVGAGAGKYLRMRAASLTITALVESGDVAGARAVIDRDLAPLQRTLNPRLDAPLAIAAKLAEGRVLIAERESAAAARALDQVIGDVRTGAAARAEAKALRAQLT